MGISNKFRERIATASVREKALIFCRDFLDRTAEGEEPIITREETAYIRDTFKSREEEEEYTSYLEYYYAFSMIIRLFGLTATSCDKYAEIAIGLISLIEGYIQEENHLNIIYQGLRDAGDSTATRKYERLVKSLTLRSAEIRFSEDGYIKIDYSPLWGSVLLSIDNYIDYFTAYKSLIEAIEKWGRKNRASSFIPSLIKRDIKEAKRDICADRGAAKYSRRELLKRINRGERVTEEERSRAVFPSYEDIEADPERVRNFTLEIEHAYKMAKK